MKEDQMSPTLSARTKYAELSGRKLAYRVIGKGAPLILCNRFRGILDSWDPAFIDKLSGQYQVILFDYSGVGLSTGVLPLKIATVAEDVKDLAAYLKLSHFILGGWSYGGAVAQTFAVNHPDMVSLLILIGTGPAGANDHQLSPLFLETASHVVNDLKDFEILFFEPASAFSRQKAKESFDRIALRKKDLDIPVPPAVWSRYSYGAADYRTDANNTREKLSNLGIPVLALCGDHDISFPVENWYNLSGKMANLFINVYPSAGHAPQDQYPFLSFELIHAFIRQQRK
ncbi:alpha/beta hydrolase [Chitinophaga filiformis]|uniref:alpha/beta fold hydrolase n=1 Tax=Chitinophaga filiformis TaxID=104663 RepID=UPI001F2A2E0A|nr:alpha/beta hydrolase [Chitinophaga filiformis]MCF6404589.1 alpha/beta hydrolase [Chitinophaga filiformis]